MKTATWGNGNKIEERVQGNFLLLLDEKTMQALVSMVRLEIGSGWADGFSDSAEDQDKARAGRALLNAINRIW